MPMNYRSLHEIMRASHSSPNQSADQHDSSAPSSLAASQGNLEQDAETLHLQNLLSTTDPHFSIRQQQAIYEQIQRRNQVRSVRDSRERPADELGAASQAAEPREDDMERGPARNRSASS